MCGDATKSESVHKLLNDNIPFLMVTDPPYGVALDPTWRDKAGFDTRLAKASKGCENYMDSGKGDVVMSWINVWKLFPGDVAYIWCGDKQMFILHDELSSIDLPVRQVLVWKKMLVMTRTNYWSAHETCLYCVRKKKSAGFIGKPGIPTAFEVASPKHLMAGSDEEKQPHPAQKPLECMLYGMRNHEGDVYEPFLGSGTTLIAAERLNRICYGMEIEPRYVDVICQRFYNETGIVPVRESDQLLFPVVDNGHKT